MEQNTKAQNLRFIIVTALVGLVILGIAIWAITFVVNSGKKSEVATVETTSSTSSNVPATSDPSAMPSAIATEDASSTEAPSTEGVTAEVSVTPPAVAPAATVPETGPEEILPFALVAGVSVAYVLSRRF